MTAEIERQRDAERRARVAKREVVVHLNVEVPEGDQRDPDEIADAILAAIEVGSDDETVYHLKVTAPLAEEL